MFYFPKMKLHRLLGKKGRYVFTDNSLHNPLKIAIKEQKGDCMSKNVSMNLLKN